MTGNTFQSTSKIMLAIWASLVLVGVLAFALERWSLGFVSFATFALSLVPPILASRWSLLLPLPFLLATTIFFIASIFLGEALDFYERLWWWDLALHGTSAVGFGMIGFLFVFMLFEGDRYSAPSAAIAFITFCVAMTIGAVWEVFEFLMDQTFGLTMQKSGLNDTMGDLMVNALGGFVASFAGYLYLVRGSAGIIGSLFTQFIKVNQRSFRRLRDQSRK